MLPTKCSGGTKRLSSARPSLSSVGAPPNFSRIALGAQHQIAAFFESDGATVTAPTPAAFWEVPIKSPLPEETFYLPRPR